MHTQAEAKKMWCPEARIKADANRLDALVVNRFAVGRAGLAFAGCIASECMHWRWAGGYSNADDAKGYCGLSGRPD